MNQTDKNIAMAKECGAIVSCYGTEREVIAMFIRELDEYTSRVCAGLKGSPCRNSCIDFCLTESLQIRIAELDKLLAEKNALIAMQAEALTYIRDHCPDSQTAIRCHNVLAATAETVESWKNRQGDKK